MFADTALAVVEQAGCSLSVPVPKELYAQPGRYDVYLRHDGDESNRLQFVVEP
jgi:hypothetical protein